MADEVLTTKCSCPYTTIATTAAALFVSASIIKHYFFRYDDYQLIPKVKESGARRISNIPVLSAPSLSGNALGFTAWAVKKIPFFRWIIAYNIKKNIKIDGFLQRRIRDAPTYFPLEQFPLNWDPAPLFDQFDLSWLEKMADTGLYIEDRMSCLQFHRLYKAGSVSPSEVAEKVIEKIKELKAMKPDLNIVTQFNVEDIREQARLSTDRYKSGRVLSVLDGIPLAIKDFFKVDGYKLTYGTPFKGHSEIEEREEEDSVVKRMRSAGVVIIAITSAHEAGLGATGAAINRSNVHVRSAMNTEYCAGGSSGGSGAAVGAGLCPLALGTDGGGSIRIPASFNGIVGLKATFARVGSDLMHSPLYHSGPLCLTTTDALVAYHYISGPSLSQVTCASFFKAPKLHFRDGFQHHFTEGSLPAGFKVGIDETYIKQAYDKQVGECVLKMADNLVKRGAELVQVSIPELFESFRAFVLTFGGEGMFLATYGEFFTYEDEYSSSLILLHSFCHKILAGHYFLAAQQKTRLIEFMREIMAKCDVLLLPGTGLKSPKIHPKDLKYGCVNLSRETEIARYTWLGNMTGLPALSVPVCWKQMSATSEDTSDDEGFVGQKDDSDIPCSVQVFASWWREDNMFLAGRALEAIRDEVIEKRSKVKFQLNLTPISSSL